MYISIFVRAEDCLSLTPTSADSPIIKIGAVVLRAVPHASPQGGGNSIGDAATGYEIFITRPLGENDDKVPPFVLPRGSRQYRDDAGVWHDARDVATAEEHATALEPFARTLAREIEEEAGVNATQLAASRVMEMGAMNFASRSKKGTYYLIHWFVVVPTAADAAKLDTEKPADASEVRWASLDEIKRMAAADEFSAGYVPVIEAALARADGAA